MTEPTRRETIRDLGEFPLLERIRTLIAARGGGGVTREGERTVPSPTLATGPGVVLGIGDDAAIIRPDPTGDLVLTCDALVAGQHFVPHWCDARVLGRRAMMANLSDLAAMGAEPCGALISLGLPADMLVQEVEELYHGFLDALDESGGRILGGNLSGSGPQWFCDITMVGRVEQGRALLRSGAQVGDRILVTGSPGRSAAGLALLRHVEEQMSTRGPGDVERPAPAGAPGSGRGPVTDLESTDLSGLSDRRDAFHEQIERLLIAQEWAQPLVRAYLSPTARVAAGKVLAAFGGQPHPEMKAAAPGGIRAVSPIHALIDLSDGLPGDLLRLCEESGVRAVLDLTKLPQDPALEAAARFFGRSRQEWSLGPSDDYELLFTTSAEEVQSVSAALRSRCDLDVSEVGEISAEGAPAVESRGTDPGASAPSSDSYRGWDHFRGAE